MSLNPARTSSPISLLGGLRDTVAGDTAGTTTAAGKREDRPPSLFWANIGVKLPGMGENGEDLFVSLPVGLALDDMKPITVKGNSPSWIRLTQAKNMLLSKFKGAAAKLEPGESVELTDACVMLYRKGEPAQEGTEDNNPLLAAINNRLAG